MCHILLIPFKKIKNTLFTYYLSFFGVFLVFLVSRRKRQYRRNSGVSVWHNLSIIATGNGEKESGDINMRS
ncbi:hypothetical protein [Gilliamella sp. Choc5-1]|uniref:hypothetical protein n=1 Tax=Gilliamella sp. Choc5-1 TaxID=3120238 RepID=UPI0011471EAB|nr:hypothetical protein [Gilliamella apicola]